MSFLNRNMPMESENLKNPINWLACVCLSLLVMLVLQGYGQKRGTNSSGKTSGIATTNVLVSHFAQLEANAEHGDAKAQCDLGGCYFNGDGAGKDYVKAVNWFRKSAEHNYAPAQYNLGICYGKGQGVTKDKVTAANWYRKAAGQNYAEAQVRLGICYESGIGVTNDYVEAAKWYRMGAEQGNADAQDLLGSLYSEGEGVAQDYAEAANWFRKAAEQGDTSGQFELGLAYRNGLGVPKDYAESVKWFLIGAEAGDQMSQAELGACYEKGEGVPKDYVEAYKWYNLAASHGGGHIGQMAEIVRKDYLINLETVMTPEQIAEAQQLSRDFRPRKGSGSDNSTSPENPTASGTGFFITDDGYLITNNHVVKDAVKVRLVTSAGTVDAKVVQVDAANDLALLKTAGKFSPLPIAASRSVHLGGTVATIGFPDPSLQGFSPKLAKGEIASLSGASDDPRYFQVSVPVQPGNSGGALVDDRGNVIGIVSAKLDASVALAASGALPENVNYAVKSSLLLSFLESVPEVSAKLKAPNVVDEKFSAVVKSAQDAAVLVLVY